MKIFLNLALLLSLASNAAASSILQPLEKGEFVAPCEGEIWWAETDATFADFDFWVGEWQIYDRATGVLLGFDEIEKDFEGCVIRQHWRQMNDRFALPGAPWRYAGGSVTAIASDGRWQQNWLDNVGGNLLLTGGFDREGTMVLKSSWIEFTTPDGQVVRQRYRWHWAPQEDGTILNWGFVKVTVDGVPEQAPWQQYFDIVYARNAPGGPAFQLVE